MELQADKINKTYKGRKVVKDVSLTLKKGEIVGLLGPNGAGKTTSFYMIVGLIKPDTGNVFLHQNNITKVPMYKRSKMGIGYLPQEVSVFRKLSVEDNIKAILEMSSLSKKEQKIKCFIYLVKNKFKKNLIFFFKFLHRFFRCLFGSILARFSMPTCLQKSIQINENSHLGCIFLSDF